jgi:hypothetical protein
MRMSSRSSADEIEQERLAWLHTRRRADGERHAELQRLMLAAAGNEQLAQALLTDPERVVDDVSHICRLSDDERSLLCAVSGATSIYDFAARLYAQLHAEMPPARLAVEGEAGWFAAFAPASVCS